MPKKFTPKAVLRSYRKKHSLTADDAGRKIGIAGTTWRSYENGSREVDGDTAVLIEKECGVDRVLIRPDLFRRVQTAA